MKLPATLAASLLERGVLPDWTVRLGIRQILRQRLIEEFRLQRKERFLREMASSAIALNTDAANAQHYELPAAFFEHILGPHLKYSACYRDHATNTLADAERRMLALTARRADLCDGQRILELGCGWGSLTLYMAACYPHARIVAVSNSRSQRVFILAKAAERGLENVDVVTADINRFDPADYGHGQPFDRVVSVEMFEHMRNYPRLLERIASWMTDTGRLFVHIFVHRHYSYPYEQRDSSDWMAEHFFTGGTMPSQDLLTRFDRHLHVESYWPVNGLHYAWTCERWLNNMDRNRAAIDALLAATYGERHVVLWRARWRTFLMACAELFRYGGGHEWFVGHYRMKKADHPGARSVA